MKMFQSRAQVNEERSAVYINHPASKAEKVSLEVLSSCSSYPKGASRSSRYIRVAQVVEELTTRCDCRTPKTSISRPVSVRRYPVNQLPRDEVVGGPRVLRL
jgi:hypothetical protein